MFVMNPETIKYRIVTKLCSLNFTWAGKWTPMLKRFPIREQKKVFFSAYSSVDQKISNGIGHYPNSLIA